MICIRNVSSLCAGGSRLIPFRTAATDACIIHRDDDEPHTRAPLARSFPKTDCCQIFRFPDRHENESSAVDLQASAPHTPAAFSCCALRRPLSIPHYFLSKCTQSSYTSRKRSSSKLDDDGSSRNSFHVSFTFIKSFPRTGTLPWRQIIEREIALQHPNQVSWIHKSVSSVANEDKNSLTSGKNKTNKRSNLTEKNMAVCKNAKNIGLMR
jgi:hypothetical protein